MVVVGVPGHAYRLESYVEKCPNQSVCDKQLKAEWAELCFSALGNSLFSLSQFMGPCVLSF